MRRIKQAFLQDIKNQEFLPSELIAHENRNFQPPETDMWASVTFAPADFVVSALGDNGSDKVDGFFQIILTVPAGAGDGKIDEKAHEIRREYPAGKVLSYDNQQVTVKGCSIGTGLISGVHYNLTLRISFYAFLNRAQT